MTPSRNHTDAAGAMTQFGRFKLLALVTPTIWVVQRVIRPRFIQVDNSLGTIRR